MPAIPAQRAASRSNRMEELWRENSPNKANFEPAAEPGGTEKPTQTLVIKSFEEFAIGPASVGEFAEVGDEFAKIGEEFAEPAPGSGASELGHALLGPSHPSKLPEQSQFRPGGRARSSGRG